MKKKESPKKKRITKNVKVSKEKYKKMKEKKGSSNVGKYSNLKKSEFAGPAGGAAPGTYPINTLARAKSALKLAHNAPNPAGIKRKVYSKYPQLKKK